MIVNPVADEKKLAELILYISEKCANDPTFGAVKLNKILCFSDFLFYAYNDRGITNVEYQKLPNGPAPRRLIPIRDGLIKNRDLAMQEVVLKSGLTQKRTVNLRRPNLEIFSGSEIAMVDRVIESMHDVTADLASELSHNLVGWLVAEDGETIPYNTIYFANPPLTEDDANYIRQVQEAKVNPEGAQNAKRRDIRTA